MEPKVTKIHFTKKRDDIGLWSLNIDDIPLDKSLIKDQQIVHFSPGGIGGNHKHPRIEWFIGIGDLFLIWIDENGEKKEINMSTEDGLLLIEIPPNLSHAVVNKSDSSGATLFEYANEKQYDVEFIEVIKKS